MKSTFYPFGPLSLMASISNLIGVHTQSMKFPTNNNHHHYDLSLLSQKHLNINNLKRHPLSLHCSLSSSLPPTSKEEAILQTKTCLSTTLEKPLNNPKLAGKLKKQKQPRFRIEIPVIDDSPESLSELALDVFGNMPIKRKGTKFNLVFIWPNSALAKTAVKSFEAHSSNQVNHIDISSATNTAEDRILNSADVAVFLAPDSSQLAVLKTVTDVLSPKPVVIFNPKWVFEDENNFGEMKSFVESFDVLYSFMGLEVKGIFSKKNGIIFKCVKDGILSGEKWNVFVEEDGKMKVVSRFKERPPISEVENVLYNLMAINSPITKSAKFFKDLASNITGKK